MKDNTGVDEAFNTLILSVKHAFVAMVVVVVV